MEPAHTSITTASSSLKSKILIYVKLKSIIEWEG